MACRCGHRGISFFVCPTVSAAPDTLRQMRLPRFLFALFQALPLRFVSLLCIHFLASPAHVESCYPATGHFVPICIFSLHSLSPPSYRPTPTPAAPFYFSVFSVTFVVRRRDVSITPSNTWGGQGMLGVTIRFDTYHNADDNLVSAALSLAKANFGSAFEHLSRLVA